MKRPRQHVLEEESKRAFVNLLPPEWIHRDKNPDYGIDMEVEITEGKDVTGKVVWAQIKATDRVTPHKKMISYRMETKHLRYYEGCQLPVIIFYYLKSKNIFYHLFAQRYIKEILALENPEWRSRKYATIKFSLDSKLNDIKYLRSIAYDGYLYVAQQQLNLKPETKSATYWLDGIPKSDDVEFKQCTLKALLFAIDNKYPSAIKEYEKILRELTISPTERMSILLNLGNAYLSLSQNDNAYQNYKIALSLTKKVGQKEASVGKSAALNNIGLILRAKGELDKALKCFKNAHKICKVINFRRGEASALDNLGIIYLEKGDLKKALRHQEAAFKIHKEIGYKHGQSSVLGNIGLIYQEKGELDYAMKYYNSALKIAQDFSFKYVEATVLGNMGLIFKAKGELDKALKYHESALKLDQEIGYKQGESDLLCNMGLIFKAKGELDKALKCHKSSVDIAQEIGDKQGEGLNLSLIAVVYRTLGDLDTAIRFLKKALKIHRRLDYKQGEAFALWHLGLVYLHKNNFDEAFVFLKEAISIFIRLDLTHGRVFNVLQNVINRITEKTLNV